MELATGRRDDALAAAALLGATSGMRAMTPLAILAAHGRLTRSGPVRVAIIAAAAGELIGDKLPNAPSRTMPIALVGRMVNGAICGLTVAGPCGAVLAAAVSGVSTKLSHAARAAAVARSGLPDPPIALVEDCIAVGTALAAARLAGRAPAAG